MTNDHLKKTAAILFLTLLLFNWFGYKLVLNYLQQRADLQLEARIDIHDYDESQLIEIKVPLQLPYNTDWEEFERCYGAIEIEGRHFTYVKMKIEDGHAILKCIPNYSKEIIKCTEHSIIKATQGIDQDHGKAPSLFAKNIKCYISDFDHEKFIYFSNESRLFYHQYWALLTAFTESGFKTSRERPPNSILFSI